MHLPGVDGLFNDALSIYRSVALDGRKIDELWIRKDLKRCGRGLIKKTSGHIADSYDKDQENLGLHSQCPDKY
jgi:hypothetical protein